MKLWRPWHTKPMRIPRGLHVSSSAKTLAALEVDPTHVDVEVGSSEKKPLEIGETITQKC